MAGKNKPKPKVEEKRPERKRQPQKELLKRPAGMNKIAFRELARYMAAWKPDINNTSRKS